MRISGVLNTAAFAASKTRHAILWPIVTGEADAALRKLWRQAEGEDTGDYRHGFP